MSSDFNQKGFSILKLIGGVFVGIIVIIILIAVFSGNGEQPKKVGESSGGTEIGTEQPQTNIFAVGEQVKLGDYILIVNSAESCISDNEFMQPESGKRFVVADISQENTGSEPRSYNLWNFTLQDDKNYSYQTAFANCKEPSFGSGTLQPAMKTRGYITFEIPQGNNPAKLIFSPDWWGTKQIIIEL